MARGRKPAKRVRIEILMDITDAAFQRLKPNLHQIVLENIAWDGDLVYLAVDSEVKE